MSFYWIIISITIIINFVFDKFLKRRYGSDRFIEIGFILNIFLSFYIIGPALVFITSGFVEGDPISYVLSGFTGTDDLDNKINLMRMVFFQLFFCFFYLRFRSKDLWVKDVSKINFSKSLNFFVTCILCLTYFYLFYYSQDFDNYIESYQRYDHLSGVQRLIISILVRFKYSFIIVFIITLFHSYHKSKFLFIPIICLLIIEFIYSAGARINLFFILMQILVLYSIYFKNPLKNLKKASIYALSLMVIFFIIEKTRTSQLENEGVESIAAIPGELSSVFFPSLHLYELRESNTIPELDPKMLFFDFIGIVLPNSKISSYDPMFWYQKNFFPNSEVPPFTIGPIANTALWEGNIGILLRSFLLSYLLAKLCNYFASSKKTIFSMLFYVFIFSTAIMILKYSIFYHVTPIVKTVLPVYFFILIYNFLFEPYKLKKNESIV